MGIVIFVVVWYCCGGVFGAIDDFGFVGVVVLVLVLLPCGLFLW